MPNGSNFILGAMNIATLPTVLRGRVPGQPYTGSFRVETKRGGTAIMGMVQGKYALGVVGSSGAGDGGTGVLGRGEATGVAGVAIGNPRAKNGIGVFGEGGKWGVMGNGNEIGVEGIVSGRGGIGVRGTGEQFGGVFENGVLVVGPLMVTGIKAAVVPHPDGSHRTLYALESPESWFEDFGRGKLRQGRAKVSLELEFRALIRTADYHVFLVPEGDCHGLFVARRTPNGFEVREQAGGRSGIAFSYRIVARRKDARAERLARVPKTKLSMLKRSTEPIVYSARSTKRSRRRSAD